jgi:membrane protein involved in colicin uptake
MSAAWTIFTDSVVAGWSSASNWVSKRWIDMMEMMGQYDPQTAEGAKKILDEDFNRASQLRQRETQAKLAATGQSFEERKKEIEEEKTGALKNLDQERVAKHRTRQEQYAADLKASQEAVDAARKEWEDARAEAARKKAAMNAPELPGGARKAIPDIAGNLAAAKSSVVGTFSGEALRGLGSGVDVQEKMEKHLAQIPEKLDRQNAALERMERNMNQGLVLT